MKKIYRLRNRNMPTAFRDASLTTARRRQLATFVWRKTDQYPENPQTVISEQRPSYGFKGYGPTGQVPTDAKLGAALIGQQVGADGTCACNTNFTFAGYDKKSPGC
jgi:hypothetical protein